MQIITLVHLQWKTIAEHHRYFARFNSCVMWDMGIMTTEQSSYYNTLHWELISIRVTGYVWNDVQHANWKVLVMGGMAALDYPCHRTVLHNGIMISMVMSLLNISLLIHKSCWSVLLTLARHVSYVKKCFTHYLQEKKEDTKKWYLQIGGPEVQNAIIVKRSLLMKICINF